MTYICPKCGNVIMPWEDESKECDFCNTITIITDPKGISDKWYDMWIDENFEELERIEQELYKQYVYASPEFDQELFDQRREKDRIEYEEMARESEEEAYRKNHPCCPNCGSEAIVTGQKGFSIWTGFIGSGATVNRCSNCGHKWKPNR